LSAPVLVVGGTRGTGFLIVQRLVADGIAVRVLARRPDRARSVLPPSVSVVAGDVTKSETLAAAIGGASDVIFTAGVQSGRPAAESRIKATEYEGVVHTLAAARSVGFAGRFLYMTASGVTTRSFATFALNLYKGNTLRWRRHAEDAIRAAGLDYTVIRAGVLVNAPGGEREIVVTQKPLPLVLWHRIARADVAEVFVAALRHPRASCATFDIVWGAGKGPRSEPIPALLNQLRPDAP
jgi:uncharacterized protein YbjT (DUF2867 family)